MEKLLVERVKLDRGYSPRGECYEYVDIFNDGTLAFGNIDGNYQGGETLTVDFGHTFKDCQDEEMKMKSFWWAVKRELGYYERNNNEFYKRIIDALERNNIYISTKITEEKRTMEKPLTIKRAEFTQKMAQVINESELPAFVIYDILKPISAQLLELANDQFLKDKEAYEQACNQELEDEAKEE